MSYTAIITDTTTGETREYDFPELDWMEHSDYLWSDGNFGCDCNRSSWFWQAGDESPGGEFGECNPYPEPNRYAVKIRVGDEIAYTDGDGWQ